MSSFQITLVYDQIEVLRRAAAAHHTDLNEDDDYSAGYRPARKLDPDTWMVFDWQALVGQGLLAWSDGDTPDLYYRITQNGLSTLKAIDEARKATVPDKQDWRALDLKVARAVGYHIDHWENCLELWLGQDKIGTWKNKQYPNLYQYVWEQVPQFHLNLTESMRVAARVTGERDTTCSYGVSWNAMVNAFIGYFSGANGRYEADSSTAEVAFLMAFDLWLEKTSNT